MSQSPGAPQPTDLPSLEDLNEIIASLPALYRAADMTTFPVASLRFINHLIPTAMFSSYNELEFNTGSARIVFEPERYSAIAENNKPTMWKYRHQHPIMRLYEVGKDDGVHMISDFLSEEEFHKLDIYKTIFGPVGLEDTLSFVLQSSRDRKIFYTINSSTRFGERDRAIARIIQPHLMQAFENVLAFTDAKAMASLSTHAFRSGSHGLILADFSGRIIHASKLASDHLTHAVTGNAADHAPFATNESLPPRLFAWLDRMDRSPGTTAPQLEIEFPGLSLVFRGAVVDGQHWIIASQEQQIAVLVKSLRDTYLLSARQADVLLWLSRGKSNQDIATILDISDRTVAKHVEHLYEKLGVENRLSATRKALDAIGG